MYPEGMTKLYSNFTPRKSRLKGIDNVVTFGIQHFILKYLIKEFNDNFFSKNKEEIIKDYSRHVIQSSYKHIEALHDLSYLNTNIIKERLSKEFINSRHSKFEDFILQFFIQYNNECNTISSIHSKKIICDTNRRRSLHDIYLITKYYYPKIIFIDIIKTILSLLKIGVIRGSYCSTVIKYVFYTINVSSHNNFEHTLEFTKELTFSDLKKYIEDEQ
jgi:hypothetical protein